MSTLLEARELSFGYDKTRRILDRASLRVDGGERVALTGPSGCGKSTLALLLSGYLTPDAGTVRFGGKPLPKKGYCPVQLICQHPEQAVNPRWKLCRTLYEGWTPDSGFLEEMGIDPKWLDRYPAELSGGELQRFCIARALGPQTRFLIADEISVMLDVIAQAQVWALLLRIIEQRGLGLLAITHNPELAKKICSRVIPFEDIARDDPL